MVWQLIRTTIQKMQPTLAKFPASTVWMGLYVSLLAAIVLSLGLAIHVNKMAKAAPNDASKPSPADVTSIRADVGPTAMAPPAIASDFVSTLPHDTPPDAAFRFVTRLTKEQGIRITQMQSKPVSTSGQSLRRTQYDIQLRGDYSAIKLVLIDTLRRFTGLTMQRFSFRNQQGDDATAQGKDDVDATIELIQYLAPATAP